MDKFLYSLFGAIDDIVAFITESIRKIVCKIFHIKRCKCGKINE